MAQTIEDLQADRATIAAARLSFLRGTAVKEVMRDGRKLVMQTPSLASLDAALAELDRQILTRSGPTVRRRRALTLSYG